MANAEKLKNILYGIIDEMAENPWLFAKDPGRDFTRCRKLGFATLLKFMLCMGGQSLNKELRQYFRCDGELMTKSAFVQQRDKLLPESAGFLFHEFNDRCRHEGTDNRLMHGYRLLAVDGSAVNVARDENAASYYPNGSGFNLLQLNVLYDLLNQTYVDMEVQPRPQEDERKALLKMLTRSAGGEKTLVVADRGYDAYAMYETINRMPDTDFLIRMKNNEKKIVRDLPMLPFDIDMEFDIRTTQRNKDKPLYRSGKAVYMPSQDTKKGDGRVRPAWPFESRCLVKVRIVRFQISVKDGLPVYETIATSLPRGPFPAEKIKELYGMRWGIETSFRDLKYTIGLAYLHAKKESAVAMEICSRLTAYNFCKRAALSVRIKQPIGGVHEYMLNFAMAFEVCMEYLRCRDNSIRGPDVESDIGRYIEPVRPGRADKRKVAAKSFVPFIYRVA